MWRSFLSDFQPEEATIMPEIEAKIRIKFQVGLSIIVLTQGICNGKLSQSFENKEEFHSHHVARGAHDG